jgi:hypothetical protein
MRVESSLDTDEDVAHHNNPRISRLLKPHMQQAAEDDESYTVNPKQLEFADVKIATLNLSEEDFNLLGQIKENTALLSTFLFNGDDHPPADFPFSDYSYKKVELLNSFLTHGPSTDEKEQTGVKIPAVGGRVSNSNVIRRKILEDQLMEEKRAAAVTPTDVYQLTYSVDSSIDNQDTRPSQIPESRQRPMA